MLPPFIQFAQTDQLPFEPGRGKFNIIILMRHYLQQGVRLGQSRDGVVLEGNQPTRIRMFLFKFIVSYDLVFFYLAHVSGVSRRL